MQSSVSHSPRHELAQLNQLIAQTALSDGFSGLEIEGVGVFKASARQAKAPQLYEPLLCLVTQGQKRCHVGESSYLYKEGDFFINFLPLPVETEVTCATPDRPFLAAALDIDLVKLADLILQLERLGLTSKPEAPQTSSCVVVGRADDELIDVFYRLVKTGNHTLESQLLGPAIIDEIYFRILTSQYGYALRLLLNQYGCIQPIARAVNFIHSNLDKSIQVQELASLSNMSKTAFFNTFKRLMHVPPNQYIKATKLQKAQTLLKQGMQAGQASFKVGYNSFSQFSREYKRFYGFPPSETPIFA